MKLIDHLKRMATVTIEERPFFMESLTIKNYGSNELTNTDMWILSNAAENNEYLMMKLKESDVLSLDTEAPEELSLDTEPTEELSLDTEPTEEKEEIVTSKEGIGILPLLGDIQDRLATGKPSEVELAALKALSKLIK